MSATQGDRPDVVIFPPLLFAICLVLGVAFFFVCPYRFPLSPWARGGGAAFGIAALSLTVWGKRVMEAAGTNVRPDLPALAIVSSGPFAYTRNPLYLGVLATFAGVGIALASPAFLTVLVPLYVVLRFGVVSREERYLQAKFGGAYRDYKSQVRRWI
jgi:protein-S-isoprenylcysteine O-methyltransferase Ste14